MKKSLIALAALSAFATAAQAQSSVSVYGILDTGTGSTETTTRADSAADTYTKTTGLGSIANGALTGSRLGFRGAEDLGGGRSATFNLELQLQTAVGGVTTGTGVEARTSTVGLSDKKLGTLEIGRQLTGIHSVITGFNPIGGSNMAGDLSYSATTANVTAATSTASVAHSNNARLHATEVRTNGFVYKSPTMGGFNFRADYTYGVSGETSTADVGSKSDNVGFSVNYANGPLKVAAGTHKTEVKNALSGTVVTAANDQFDASINVVAAQYVVGKTTLFGLYGTRKVNQEASSVLSQAAKVKTSQAGISYPVTAALTLSGIYGEGSIEGANSVTNKRDTKSYLVNAVYSLSKRTNVYTAYGYEEAVVKSDTSSTSIDDGDYVKTKQFQVGVRHSF